MSRFGPVILAILFVGALSFGLALHAAPASAQANPLSAVGSMLASVANAPPAQEAPPAGPVVRAFMFSRANCTHCEEAKRQILPPIVEMFGPQLDLRYLWSDTQMGKTLFEIAVVHYGIEDPGVPLMVVGDQVFQGTAEIRDLFPAAVVGYLDQGGADWPNMPGLEYAIAEAGDSSTAIDAGTAEQAVPEPTPTETQRPTATVQATATTVPTPTPPPAPSPSPTPSGRFGGCFGSIALSLLAVGVVVVPPVRRRFGATLR